MHEGNIETTRFRDRLARMDDVERLRPLMRASIGELLTPHLSATQVQASFELMGIDTQLIEDGTYFVVESGADIAGCGGWSRRATLFGGDHTGGRDARLLDPATEAARVRAMYTDPRYVRRGVGRRILELCERAAAAEGFTRLELASTMAGLALYRACGYRDVEPFERETSDGTRVPLVRMSKAIR